MDAWRSSCPRLAIWEDALADGLVQVKGGAERAVVLSPAGRARLAAPASRAAA